MLEALRIVIQLIPGAYLEVEMLESINVFFMLSLMTWWLTFLNVDEPSSQSLGISYCWINLSLTNDSRWIIRWLWRFQLITELRIRQISQSSISLFPESCSQPLLTHQSWHQLLAVGGGGERPLPVTSLVTSCILVRQMSLCKQEINIHSTQWLHTGGNW